MKFHAKISMVLFLVYARTALPAQLGSQGMRQQVASLTDICTEQFSKIEGGLENCCTQLDSQLELIGSKIDNLTLNVSVDLTPIISKLDLCCTQIDSQLDRIESKIDLPTCAATPLTTSTTLVTPGAYCLANNISGDLAITGTGITLDLSGRTISGGTYGINISGDQVIVHNGTIQNALLASLMLSGNKCLIESVDLVGSGTGLYMYNGTENRISNCSALNNNGAGFSLLQSSTNTIDNCKAVSTVGTSTTYGFVSGLGYENIFEQCTAENTVSNMAQAFGMYCNDAADKLIANQVFGVQSAASASAAGMALAVNSLWLIAGYEYGSGLVNSAAWSPNGQYLAIGGANLTSGQELKILAFNGTSLSLITSYEVSANVYSVNWSPDGQYLAIGTSAIASVQVLAFTGTSLSLTATYEYGTNVYSVNWSPNEQYLAVGGANAAPVHGVHVLAFTGTSLSLTATYQYDAYVQSVNWSPNGQYLAFGGSNLPSGPEVQVLAFTGTSLSLTTSYEVGAAVISVNWSPNGQYLAFGRFNVPSGPEMRVLAFTGTSLSLTASYAYGSSVYSVNWSPNGQYLAIGGNTAKVQILAFAGTSLSLVANYQYGSSSNAIYSANWAPNGRYLAVGGSNLPAGQEAQVLQATFDSSRCILQNNLVSGVHSLSGALGKGYYLNACTNFFIDNTAYNNDTDYYFTTTCSGVNIHSQLDVIESKLGACCTQIDSQLDRIESKIDINDSQISSQLSALDSKVAVCCTQLDSQLDRIESKIDIAGSKLDLVESKLDLPTCAATPITASTTLSTPGAYCLANNISGDMAITGTGITLDLSGRTISGGTYGVTISGDQVTVRNGTIQNALLANMMLSGNKCLLESIDLIGSITGLCMNNCAENRIVQCCALNNTSAGFSLQQSATNNFIDCTSMSTSGSNNTFGYVSTNGTLNTFENCAVNNTVSTGTSAYGFYLADNADTMIANTIFGVRSAGTTPALGLDLSTMVNLIYNSGWDYGSSVQSVAWSPNGKYLAVGGQSPLSGNEVQVYYFNGTSLSLTASYVYGNTIESVDWSPNGQYLAIGGSASGNQIVVYYFDGSSLSPRASYNYLSVVYTVNWSPNGQYLAAGGISSNINVYYFDGYSLTLRAFNHSGNGIHSVDWSPSGQYLAVGGQNTIGNQLQIYYFDGSSLSLAAGYPYGNTVVTVNWSPNGRYLALGGQSPLSGNELQICYFNYTSLTLVDSRDYGNNLFSVNWSPDGLYLAIGGYGPASGKALQIYNFNNSSLTLATEYDYGGDIYSTQWSPNGYYLALGGDGPLSGKEVQVFYVTFPATNCMVKDNLVSDVHSASGSLGVGYSLNACTNCFMDNTAYNNDTDYGFTTTCSGENIYSQLDVIESKINQIDFNVPCAATPVTTSTILSTPGTYCLANNISGDFGITGTGITLDLASRAISGGTYGITISGDQVTVRNGTIQNALLANIMLSGNKCLLESIDLIGSSTGLFLYNGTQNRVTDCCALNNTAAGFSLLHSATNTITGCTSLGTTGSNQTFGFIATNGILNTFENCKAENTSSTGNAAYGFYITDSTDQLLGNNVFGVQSANSYAAQGITLPSSSNNMLGLLFATGIDYGGVGKAILSANWSPNGAYLAIGGNVSGNDVQVYSFANNALTFITSVSHDNPVFAVNWSPNGRYLAVGGESTPPAGETVKVYTFDGTSLNLTASYQYAATNGGVFSLKWSPNGQYLAAGGFRLTSGNPIQVYSFNGSSLIITASHNYGYNNGETVYSVDWSPSGNYLAVGGYQITADYDVQVFAFNITSLSLTASYDYGTQVESVNWSPNGIYLATGGYGPLSGREVQVYQFNVNSLTLTASYDYGTSVAAVNWSPNGGYLAIGGNPQNAAYEAQIYTFNGSSLISTASYDFGIEPISALNWAPNSQYIAFGGGNSPNDLQIVSVQYPAGNCIVKNNVVSNVHATAGNNGIGYTLNACQNLFMDNTAYNNDVNYQITSSCAGDNLWSQFDAMQTSLSSQIETVNINTIQIDSKLDTIQTMINIPTLLTTSSTIATAGSYRLANNITGDFSITGTNITLDLNGYTITAANTGITISGNYVTVKNGNITNAPTAGIWLNGADGCNISNITYSGTGSYGFILTNSANNNTFNNCQSSGTTYFSYLVYQSHRNVFNKCYAKSCGMYGFALEKSDYNTLQECEAVNVTNLAVNPPTPPGSIDPYNADETAGILIHLSTYDVIDKCQVQNVYNANGSSASVGIWSYESDYITISNCVVDNITAGNLSYGISLMSNVGRTGSVVSGNKATHAWKGIQYSSPYINNSIFVSNNSIANTAVTNPNWSPSPFITGTIYGGNNYPTPS